MVRLPKRSVLGSVSKPSRSRVKKKPLPSRSQLVPEKRMRSMGGAMSWPLATSITRSSPISLPPTSSV